MDLIKSIRNAAIVAASQAADNKIDGRKIGKDIIEGSLDKSLQDEKASEKIQRGPITNLLFEIIEGLWDPDYVELNTRIESWQNEVGKNSGGKEQ